MKISSFCTKYHASSANLQNIYSNLLFLDIETTGLSRTRSHLYLIGCGWLEKDPEASSGEIASSCDSTGSSSHAGESYEDYLFNIKQWFIEKPSEEKEVLGLFSDFLNSFQNKLNLFSEKEKRFSPENPSDQASDPTAVRLVHFNGSSFDIPYLKARYQLYHLPDPFNSGFLHSQLDLYRLIRPFSNLLGLSRCRQRDVEHLLGIYRDDPFTGGELIGVYQKYLQTADPRLFDTLLLHNREDIEALPSLLPLLGYTACLEGNFRVTEIADIPYRQSSAAPGSQDADLQTADSSNPQTHNSQAPDPKNQSLQLSTRAGLENAKEKCYDPESCPIHELIIRGRCALSVPAPLQAENEYYRISLAGSDLMIHIRIFTGTLCFFFSDYRNYYYLPLEDTAIHKSVGTFVDPKYRRTAKASEAYQKIQGTFIPVPKSLELPDSPEGRKYYASYKSDPSYMLLRKLDPDPENPFWKTLAFEILRQLLQKH